MNPQPHIDVCKQCEHYTTFKIKPTGYHANRTVHCCSKIIENDKGYLVHTGGFAYKAWWNLKPKYAIVKEVIISKLFGFIKERHWIIDKVKAESPEDCPFKLELALKNEP